MLVPFAKWRLANENNAISGKKKQGAFIRSGAFIRIMAAISENRETSICVCYFPIKVFSRDVSFRWSSTAVKYFQEWQTHLHSPV